MAQEESPGREHQPPASRHPRRGSIRAQPTPSPGFPSLHRPRRARSRRSGDVEAITSTRRGADNVLAGAVRDRQWRTTWRQAHLGPLLPGRHGLVHRRARPQGKNEAFGFVDLGVGSGEWSYISDGRGKATPRPIRPNHRTRLGLTLGPRSGVHSQVQS